MALHTRQKGRRLSLIASSATNLGQGLSFISAPNTGVARLSSYLSEDIYRLIAALASRHCVLSFRQLFVCSMTLLRSTSSTSEFLKEMNHHAGKRSPFYLGSALGVVVVQRACATGTGAKSRRTGLTGAQLTARPLSIKRASEIPGWI